LSCGIHRKEFGLFNFGAADLLRIKRLANPFQNNVWNQGACARYLIKFHWFSLKFQMLG
jgi:hypothetical protein